MNENNNENSLDHLSTKQPNNNLCLSVLTMICDNVVNELYYRKELLYFILNLISDKSIPLNEGAVFCLRNEYIKIDYALKEIDKIKNTERIESKKSKEISATDNDVRKTFENPTLEIATNLISVLGDKQTDMIPERNIISDILEKTNKVQFNGELR